MRLSDSESFVRYMTEEQLIRPANMENIVAINQGKQSYSLELPEVVFLNSAGEDAFLGGDYLVDVRPGERFCKGYLPGALHMNAATATFEQDLGWILPSSAGLVLAIDETVNVEEVLQKLAFVGLAQRVNGCIDMDSWMGAGVPLETVPRMDVETLEESLAHDTFEILDVREPDEWRSGVIDSARKLSFRHFRQQWNEGKFTASRETPIAVICAGGTRSLIAYSLLRNLGFREVYNVVGGMEAWQKADFPTISG